MLQCCVSRGAHYQRAPHIRIIVGCPTPEPSECVVLTKARGIGGVAAVPWPGRVEAKERHYGMPLGMVVGVGGGRWWWWKWRLETRVKYGARRRDVGRRHR
jgi:hypothetical protein